MPTLLQVLQRKNPDIADRWAGSSYQNTTSSRFDEVSLDDQSRAHVQEWKDFTYDSIYLAYGDILEQSLDAAYREVQTPSATPTTILDENGIDSLGLVWSCNIERMPLKVAAPILRQRRGMATTSLAGAPDPTLASKHISWRHPTDRGVSTKPDWALLDRALSKKYRHAHRDDPENSLVYAVGDSKLTQKWKSVWLTYADRNCVVNTDPPYHRPNTPAPAYQKTKDISDERIKPLKQLATYCRYGETRYGYLITQTELVALRVRRIPGSASHNAAVEYRAIPWSANGPNKLTAHLAIWALGCMGMNDAHRAMEGPNNSALSHMAKLTWWKEDKAKKTFTNVISQRVIAADKWAKFHAGVAVQTDEASGQSPTSNFIVGPPPLPAGLTQQMGKLNISNPPPAAGGATQQKRPATATTPSSKTAPSAAAVSATPKRYTKCTIEKKKYDLSKDSKGNYVVLDSHKKVKYTLVENSKEQWVVKETKVVVKME